MNADRRKTLRKALEQLAHVHELIEGVHSEETEAHENLPDNMRDGAQGEKMQEAIDALQNALDSIEQTQGELEEVAA